MELVLNATDTLSLRVGRYAPDGSLALLPETISVSWNAETKELVVTASKPDTEGRDGVIYKADLDALRLDDHQMFEFRQRFDSLLRLSVIERVEKEGDCPLADHYSETGIAELVKDVNVEFSEVMDGPMGIEHTAETVRTANDLFERLMSRVAARTDQRWERPVPTDQPAGSETFERLRKMLAGHLLLEPEDVVPSCTWDDLRADSLDLVELVMAVEAEFGVEIDDEAADCITTVGEMAALIDKLAAATRQLGDGE